MTPAEIRAKAEELRALLERSRTPDAKPDNWMPYVYRTLLDALPALLAEVETLTAALLAARAEALREAAEVADATVEMWRAKDPNATFQHIARTIRALAANQEPADE